MSSSVITDFHGVKIEKNLPQSKLDELDVKNWMKWESEPAVITGTVKPGEFMYFLEGKMKVKVETHEDWYLVEAGDLAVFPLGMTVTVEVVEAVKKVYSYIPEDDNNEAAASA